MRKSSKNNPETNPFVNTLEIKAKWIVEQQVINDVYEASQVVLASTRPVEVDNWCNIYTDHLLHVVIGMSSAAKDMIFWLLAHIGYEIDIIEIREDKYCEEMKVSGRTFYKARNELLNRFIIPRASRRNTYWINPTYFFRGKRAKSYPKNLVMMNDNPLSHLRVKTMTVGDRKFTVADDSNIPEDAIAAV